MGRYTGPATGLGMDAIHVSLVLLRPSMSSQKREDR